MIAIFSICYRSAHMIPLVVCILSMIVANYVPFVYAKQVTLQPAFTLTMMGARRGKGGNLSKHILLSSVYIFFDWLLDILCIL